MTFSQNKFRLPALCIAVTGISYYLLLFTNAGNYYHGGSPREWLALNICMLVGAYCCMKVARSSRPMVARFLAGLLGAPLAAIALASVWYAATR